MVKGRVVGVMIMTVLTFTTWSHGGVSEIINGSFEDDGAIGNIVTKEPNGWDVNIPVGGSGLSMFDGWVWDDWSSHELYSLTLYSFPDTFDANTDTATISQQVYLEDVNEINFNLKLRLDTDDPWDPSVATAFLMIDSVVVWESNNVGTDVSGEYYSQIYKVAPAYKTSGLHELSFGLKINATEYVNVEYHSQWDDFWFYRDCNGLGKMPGDIDYDCDVDTNDLQLLAGKWLDYTESEHQCNLYNGDDTDPNGIINFRDFTLYSHSWDGNTIDLEMFAGQWLEEVAPEDQYNLFKGDDIDPNGIINFFDFTMLNEDWMVSGYN